MNKFAIAIAALSLSAGAAFAENPNFGRTDVQPSSQVSIDRTTTASIKSGNNYAAERAVSKDTSSVLRYGDAAPYAGR